MVSTSTVLALASAKPMYVVVAVAVKLLVSHSPSPELVTLSVALKFCVPPEAVPTFNETSSVNVLVRTMYSLFTIVCMVCVTSALVSCKAPVTLAPELVVLTLIGVPETTVQSSMLVSKVPFLIRFLGRNINESQSTLRKSEGREYSCVPATRLSVWFCIRKGHSISELYTSFMALFTTFLTIVCTPREDVKVVEVSSTSLSSLRTLFTSVR